MLFEAFRNAPAVYQGTQKFIAYFQLVLATFFSAIVVFSWVGLAIAVVTGTAFSLTDVAGILTAQILCVLLIFNSFVGGYTEKRKLLSYSEDNAELPSNQLLVTRRARATIAIGYLTLACVSTSALMLYWYGLLNELLAGVVLAAENLSVILVSQLACVALVTFLFVRGFTERSKLRMADENS